MSLNESFGKDIACFVASSKRARKRSGLLRRISRSTPLARIQLRVGLQRRSAIRCRLGFGARRATFFFAFAFTFAIRLQSEQFYLQLRSPFLNREKKLKSKPCNCRPFLDSLPCLSEHEFVHGGAAGEKIGDHFFRDAFSAWLDSRSENAAKYDVCSPARGAPAFVFRIDIFANVSQSARASGLVHLFGLFAFG